MVLRTPASWARRMSWRCGLDAGCLLYLAMVFLPLFFRFVVLVFYHFLSRPRDPLHCITWASPSSGRSYGFVVLSLLTACWSRAEPYRFTILRSEEDYYGHPKVIGLFVATVPNRNLPPEVMVHLPDPQAVLRETRATNIDRCTTTFSYPSRYPKRKEQVLLIPNSFAHLPL
jgi:hypothetical protein